MYIKRSDILVLIITVLYAVFIRTNLPDEFIPYRNITDVIMLLAFVIIVISIFVTRKK
ncbi:hypothetical protein [Metabacillus fastidiosus]|uniref:hypothetical protein n=1 Tax=Metabacillus fastidiosus TaxID=1458 RepID=UPI003D2A9782